MKANHVMTEIDAEIIVHSVSGDKVYPFTLEVSGAVEHYEVYDMVINNSNVDLTNSVDADDFMQDVLQQHHSNEIDSREEY
jgi:hypothetical protein